MGFHIPCRIDSAYFPGSVFHRGRNTQAEVFDTGHGPFRALIVSNLKWGGPCRGHYVFPQTLSSPTAPNHDNLPPGRKTYIHTPPSRPLGVPAAFYGNAGTGKTKAVFTDEDTEEEILDTALADDTTVTISAGIEVTSIGEEK